MAGKKPAKPSKGGASKSTTTSKPQKPAQQQTTTTTTTAEDRDSEEELKRQQTLLDIFRTTFRDVLGADDFAARLQEVKGALFNRDFEGAFAREAALDVYAARWSPTRALCYARVLRGLDVHLQGLVGDRPSGCVDQSRDDDLEKQARGRGKGEEEGDEHGRTRDSQDESAVEEDVRDAEQGEADAKESSPQPLKILAIGGAAAEIVAFADYISHQPPKPPIQVDIALLDIGPWGSVTSRLHTALTSIPPISRYASAATKAANNTALVSSPAQFHSRFIQRDILSLPGPELAGLIRGTSNDSNGPILITLLFTLNELYTAGGIKPTTTFLRQLSSPSTALTPGSLLLVVDSPGSYSEAAVGGDREVKKRYPMQWLLEHTLIPPPSRRKTPAADSAPEGEEGQQPKLRDDGSGVEETEKGGIRWEKVESHDSVWFRVAEGLRYPIALENMRYQMHLYRAFAA